MGHEEEAANEISQSLERTWNAIIFHVLNVEVARAEAQQEWSVEDDLLSIYSRNNN